MILAICILVVIEVVQNRILIEKRDIPSVHPPDAEWHYGYSMLLAWVVFITYLTAAMTFFLCSRKRKRDLAPNEDYAIEEEDHIIGR